MEIELKQINNQKAHFETIDETITLNGSEEEFLFKEEPNMRLSPQEQALYELAGQELPVQSARGEHLPADRQSDPLLTKPKRKPLPNYDKETIGLQLVDLGLGSKFHGESGKEKDHIKKNAVDWYLKKEQRSPEMS